MREEIKSCIGNPGQLEKMYRDNKLLFRREFYAVYPEIKENITAQVWNERLTFDQEEISWGTRSELIFVIVASIIAGLIAKFPAFTGINEEYFYPRNAGFIFFPLLTIYFAWKQKLPAKRFAIYLSAIIISAVYINLLPIDERSDTLILACIHLPLFMWAVVGFTFVSNNLKSYQRRLDYLKYSGDLLVMSTIILISGALLAAITSGLFELIQIRIEDFYAQYIVIWGLAAAPVLGTYLIQTNPQLVNKVSPVIAKIFTPLVLVTLIIYLVAVIYTGKDPYNDREFLLIFNLLLIGVMAIILFSVTGTSKSSENKISTVMLLGLSIVTIIVNGIAVSAIIYRISEWGITPNRLAVLGGNILMLTNLLLVTFKLFKAVKESDEIVKVAYSIAAFVPVYIVWTMIVTFLFPLLFGFK